MCQATHLALKSLRLVILGDRHCLYSLIAEKDDARNSVYSRLHKTRLVEADRSVLGRLGTKYRRQDVVRVDKDSPACESGHEASVPLRPSFYLSFEGAKGLQPRARERVVRGSACLKGQD